MPEVLLPYPHAGQRSVRRAAKRHNWLAAGRRWRKTTLVMAICVEAAHAGQKLIWGAPVYDQVRIGWGEARKAAAGYAEFRESRMTAEFPGGGEIVFRSLDNPDNARGHTADGVVIDECGDVQPSAWYEVLRPMLIDTGGWSWGIGTPKGRNWFWQEHVKAADRDDSAAWQAPTLGARIAGGVLVREPHPLENPDIPFAELEQLFATMPEQTFRQEILAEFVEADGTVFRKVSDAATAEPLERGEPKRVYVWGCDWGRHHDFTVVSVIDVAAKRQVALDRFNQVDFSVQVGRLKAMSERFKPALVVAEANSFGIPVIEDLRAQKFPVHPWQASNATKAQAVETLALAFERGALTILSEKTPMGKAQMAELLAYEASKLPSGLIRYAAPEGMHDDTVVALMLANLAAQAPQRENGRMLDFEVAG